MYRPVIWALLVCSLVMTVSGSAPFRFDNPVKNDMLPCSEFNLNTTKLDPGFSIREKVGVCHAIEKIANKTKTTKWSKPVREEIENIWSSFLSSDVKIAPMPKKMSGRVAAAVKAVLPSGNGRMKATLYLRPEKTGSSRFFLTVMHELRHVYDYEQIWKTRSALTEAEMERRGFRTMGRIAAETPEKESFFRLPKLWDENWANLSPTQIERLREDRIERYMSKSRFYKHLIKEPNKYIVGYLGSPVRNSAGELTLQSETRREVFLIWST